MSHALHRFHHVGQQYGNYKVTKAIEIAELSCYLTELTHEPSGAQIVHIGNQDPENVFCLSLQTIPETSNGVAHILEHTVLCGSRKFPIKDPFFAMSRRSLNTFMNALTGQDFTCYPAASQEPKDFYNLLEVYLDAVFHPNLQKNSFLQEGWRLEFANPTDATSPLEYKGVVYNEMKGAMASPNARLNALLNQALFPDITYGYNSGGDPLSIPSLTYEELKAFHQKFYQPSRCLFFFYGNLPLQNHLDVLEKEILKDAPRLPPLPPLPRQPRFTTPRYLKSYYPITPEQESDNKALIAFGWLTCDILDQEAALALSIIEFILLDNDASPLRKALLKSGLCKHVSAHIDTDMSEAPFSIVLKGCQEKDAPLLETIIKMELERIANEGLSLIQVENALHQLEFNRSEITHDQGPFGLTLFMRSALLKQHGADVEAGLHIHSLSDLIRRRNLENPSYFNNLIKKYLCHNTHFVQVILAPSSTLASEEIAQERALLNQIKADLSAEETELLITQAKELMSFQAQQEEVDEDILPKVSLADVSKLPRHFPLQHDTYAHLNIFRHNTFTNGIVYADIIYNLPHIEEEELPYIRLFTNLLPQMGCGPRNYSENLEYIQEHTGGINCVLSFNLQAADPHSFSPSICLRGKALHRKAPKLFNLFFDMLTSVDFTDLVRLKEVISKHILALDNGVHHHSLQYAINLSAASLNFSSRIAYAWYGLEYYHTIKKLELNYQETLPQLSKKLTHLKNTLLCLDKPDIVLTCDGEFYQTIKQQHFYGLDKLPTKPYAKWQPNYAPLHICSQGRITSSPIAFTAMVLKGVPYQHPHSAALQVASFLCTNLVLHSKIREQGGAYGSGAVANAMAGTFYFYAYRDPRISSTLEAFRESIEEIVAGHFEATDLEEAQLEMLQGLDAPVSPGDHGEVAYHHMREGRTNDVRAEFRRRLLNLSKEEVIVAVRAHLLPQLQTSVAVVFAGKELLEMENQLLASRGYAPLKIETI